MCRRKRSANGSWAASSVQPRRKETCLEPSRTNGKTLSNQVCPSGLKVMKTEQWVEFLLVCGCCPVPSSTAERPRMDRGRCARILGATPAQPLQNPALLNLLQSIFLFSLGDLYYFVPLLQGDQCCINFSSHQFSWVSVRRALAFLDVCAGVFWCGYPQEL